MDIVLRIKVAIARFFKNHFNLVKFTVQPEDKYKVLSFSQEGEDIVLKRLFRNKQDGFYVDIGAHHPFRLSNTYLFYKNGWRGINIDPLPESEELFKKYRSEDINLCIGISSTETELKYYMFNEPALNTFNEKEAQRKDGSENKFFIEKVISVQTKRLETILDNYLPKNKRIDFLTIDVEGHDIEVLKSNNWEKYSPKIILVEELRSNISDIIKRSEINHYLNEIGYKLYYRTYNTSFYLKKDK